jgi:hypothetical protein
MRPGKWFNADPGLLLPLTLQSADFFQGDIANPNLY